MSFNRNLVTCHINLCNNFLRFFIICILQYIGFVGEVQKSRQSYHELTKLAYEESIERCDVLPPEKRRHLCDSIDIQRL